MRLLLLVLLIAVGWASPAAARVQTYPTGHITAGPVLAGDDVVWATQESNDEVVVRAARPGSLRTLTRIAPEFELAPLVRLEASVSHVIVSVQRPISSEPGGGVPITQTLLAVSLDGKVERLVFCPSNPAPFDVDGGRVIFRRCNDDGTSSLVVRELGTGVERTVGRAFGGQLAGDLAAFRDNDGIVVVNVVTGAEVLRVTQQGSATFDVDAGGRLLILSDTTFGSKSLALASPDSPFPRQVVPASSDQLIPRVVNGRAFYLRSTDRNALGLPAKLSQGVPGAASELLDPDASIETIGNLDVDERRRASLRSTCRGVEIVVADLMQRVREPRECKLALARGPTIDRAGRVRLQVDCSSFLGRCRGTARLDLPGRGRTVGRGRLTPTGRLVVGLDRATRTRLRGKGPIRLVLRATITDDTHRQERGSRSIILRR